MNQYDLSLDEIKIIQAYRRVTERGFGGLDIAVGNRKLIKLFEIIKNRVDSYTFVEAVEK